MAKNKITKVFILIALLSLNACATGTWKHNSGSSSNLSYDGGFCETQANSMVPIYICANPFMCVGEEIGRVWGDIAKRENAFKNCMHKKGYRYVEQ